MNRNELENRMIRTSDDLCEIAAELGYDTAPQQLACENGSHVSGLMNFFDDNPGAMEAVMEWLLDSSLIEDNNPEG